MKRHLTFANAASALALFVALGGGSALALSGGDVDPSKGEKLQPGTVVRGMIGATDHTSASPGAVRTYASLPRGARLPAGATDTAVTVDGGADSAEHDCTGTAPAFRKPLGKSAHEVHAALSGCLQYRDRSS